MNQDYAAVNAIAALEAESSILGALLLDNRVWDRIGGLLKPEHFASEQNRIVFAEIARQLNACKPCDVVTTYEALQQYVELSDLHALVEYMPGASNLRQYAETVLERFRSRQLMAVSGELSELARDHATPIADRIDKAQSQLSKLIEDTPQDEWISAYQAMATHTQVLDDRAEGRIRSMSTGLHDLDEYLEGGLRPGELVIVGARPSMGKTALGLTIGTHMALEHSVGLLSMEMSHSEVNDRLTAMLGNVTMSSVKRPKKGDGLNWTSVLDGVEKAKALNFHTSDQGGLNINQVRAKARALKRAHGLNVLVVDYIGLMSGLDPRMNRNHQLGEISRGLKSLAKELAICVVCLAQLNRNAEEKTDQMPQMSNLRDSGEIEQDADVILFIKRPIMANPELGPEWNYYAKLSVAKNRQGRCGYLNLAYIGEQTKFTSWAGEPPKKQATTTQHRGGME